MNPGFWQDLHGAATHLPIALVWVGLGFDVVGVAGWHRASGPSLRAAGGWMIAIAALGSVPAVASGLVMARGDLGGAGALRWHHLFAWPAFALIVACATWRTLMRRGLTRRRLAGYACVEAAAAVLVAGAGYWGGELLKAFP